MWLQLRKRDSIKIAITALTVALVGGSNARAADQDQVESSVLIYKETDRVSAAEGILGISKHLRGEYLLGLRLTYDGLTGASPNGATPASRVQTFTRPSGNGAYTAQPGQTPLDDTFKDTRIAVDGNLGKTLGRMTQLTAGIHFSTEHDYSSFGLSGGIAQDFFKKNTTLGFSGSYSRDAVSPEGGAPVPFGVMRPSSGGGEHEGDDDDEGEGGPSEAKDVVDGIISLNQVVDRSTIIRLNYSFNHSSGYLTDPYKLLTVVENSSSANPGAPESYVYEKRPDSRTKHALFGEVRRYLGGNTLDLSYRYFWDDWGSTSHTADLFFDWQIKNGHGIEPHIRWYSQSEADIHRYFLVSGEQLPQYASADSRLAKFDALTLGLTYSLPLDALSHLHISAEYYTQMGDKSPPEAFGELRQFELFPKMNALMLRLGYTRDF